MFGSEKFKVFYERLTSTPTGRVVFIFGMAMFAALIVFGMIAYSFSRPPVDKKVKNQDETNQTTTVAPTLDTFTPTVSQENNRQAVLAAIESNSRLLIANNIRGFYDNLAESTKQYVSFDTINALFVARFGSDYKITSATRLTEPVFTNDTASADILVNYTSGQNLRSVKFTSYYLNENGDWKLNLLK